MKIKQKHASTESCEEIWRKGTRAERRLSEDVAAPLRGQNAETNGCKRVKDRARIGGAGKLAETGRSDRFLF